MTIPRGLTYLANLLQILSDLYRRSRMSTPTPTINPALPALARIAVDFAVRGIVRNSDPKVVAARCTAVIGISNALIKLDTGDPSGTMALEAVVALAKSPADPGLTDALDTIATTVAEKLVSVAAALQGTAAGALVATLNTAVLQRAIVTAQAYMPTASSPAT